MHGLHDFDGQARGQVSQAGRPGSIASDVFGGFFLVTDRPDIHDVTIAGDFVPDFLNHLLWHVLAIEDAMKVRMPLL